ncbi:MAG: histidinol-phosphate transaminase [Planctomycetes bacterium]|nr:histidinol-phosphate transaminase [Planctomycetota bacterium]
MKRRPPVIEKGAGEPRAEAGTALPLLRTPLRSVRVPGYEMDAPGLLPMHANTNLLGQNPAVLKEARRAAGLESNQYPTENAEELCAALAEHHGLPRSWFLAGNGCDEVIDLLAKTFLDPGEAMAYPVPAFVMYRFYASVNLGRAVEIPLQDDGKRWHLDIEGLLATRAKVIVVASPNNPTGNAFPPEEIRELARRAAGIVAVDEAYADFCGQDLVPETRRTPNLVVLRTFSKAYGLAGLRVGYAAGQPAVIDAMRRAKPPFNVSSFSERVAVRALRERAYWDKSVATLPLEREKTMKAVAKLGCAVWQSDANFFLMRAPKPLAADLKKRGILVRDVSGHHASLAGCIRVTVGDAKINARFLRALGEIL